MWLNVFLLVVSVLFVKFLFFKSIKTQEGELVLPFKIKLLTDQPVLRTPAAIP